MNMGKLESLQINPRPAGVKPGQTKNERQPPALGYQEDWDLLPVGQCRSARPIRPGCQSVKAGKTKFTGSWSNRVCYNSFQINDRPPWVKPGQTSTYRHRPPNGPTGDRVKPGKTKTELVTHMQLFGFPSGRLTRLPCRSRQAVKPGKTKNGRPGLPPPVILMQKPLI